MITFLYGWFLRLIAAGDAKPQGSERRFRCRKCSEIGFFYADPAESTTFSPRCVKCDQENRLFVPGPKQSEEKS